MSSVWLKRWLALVVAVVLVTCVCAMPSCANSGASQTSANSQQNSGTEDSDNESDSAASSGSSSGAASDASKNDEQVSQEELDELAGKLPYVGMKESLIDKTWLGMPKNSARVGYGVPTTSKYEYYWYSTNGKNDKLFSAYVCYGVVVDVGKCLTLTDYWMNADGTSKDLPDRDASGKRIASGSSSSSSKSSSTSKTTPKEDPSDYSTPEEYADNAQKDFESKGSKDGWKDAYEYWEDNAL
jgi:hypothetical protein